MRNPHPLFAALLACAAWILGCDASPPRLAPSAHPFLGRLRAPDANRALPSPLPGTLEIANRIEREDSRRPESRAMDVDFDRVGVPPSWRFAGVASPPRIEDGQLQLEMHSRDRDGEIFWPVALRASALTHLLVEIPRLAGRVPDDELRVSWRESTGVPFDPQRTAFAPYSEIRDGWLRIALATKPEWRGAIGEFKISLGNYGVLQIASLRSIHAADFVRGTEPGVSAGTLEIDRLRRRVLRVAPTSRLSESLRIEKGDSFHAHAGLHPETAFLPASATRFEVAVHHEGARESLASFDLGGSKGSNRWQAVDVDLSAFAGQTVEIALDATAQGAAEETPTGAPVWAEPRLRRESGGSGPNLLLISLDTLRADHLESYGYSRQTSPTISELAAQGLLFSEARSHAPTTLPSHASLLTGRPAHELLLAHGAREALSEEANTLAEILRDRGFATGGFAGGAYLDPFFGLSQGFDVYSYAKSQNRTNYFDTSDIEDNIALAIRWLERQGDRRFFLFFHSYEVHSPYDPRVPEIRALLDPGVPEPVDRITAITNSRARPLEPPNYHGWRKYIRFHEPTEQLTENRRAQMIASYDSEIRFADGQLERLLRAFEARGLLDDTVVLFTSDHGEAFLEHGRIEHGHLYDHNLRVPLILRYPKALPRGVVVEDRVHHSDVLATLLDLLQLDPAPDGRGSSLVAMAAGTAATKSGSSVAYSRSSGLSVVSRDGLKLISNITAKHPLAGRVEIYDLERDPGELVNLVSELASGERAGLDREMLRAFEELAGLHLALSSSSAARIRGRLTLVGSENPLREQLRALPLGENWISFDESGNSAEIETGLLPAWRLHLESSTGNASFQGELEFADGTRVAFDERLDLGALDPEQPDVRSLAREPHLASLRARWVGTPSAGADSAGGLSPETQRQLEALGYTE